MTLDRQLLADQPTTIRLDDLSNGPGILPFNLGMTKIVSHYHSFLQEIDINIIQGQIDSLRTQLTDSLHTLSRQNFQLLKYQFTHLFKKLDTITSWLETFKPTRFKRGLINPLGTFLKSLTGNLDNNDALRFENAIKTLQKNDNQLSISINKHISLFKDMTVQQNLVLDNLKLNQQKLEKAIVYLLNVTDKSYVAEYVRLSQLINILGDNIQDLTLEIIRLENILAFSHTNSMHHSILTVKQLNKISSRLNSLYSSEQLLDLESRYYYNLISLGSYFVNSKVVIVLNFPILYPTTYSLYKLCPVPNNKSEIILPPFPYIATNSKEFVYIEAECPKIDKWYICDHKTIHQRRTRRDCIYNLILQRETDNLCQTTKISLHKEALLELDSQHYVISIPKPTKVEFSCNQEEHHLLQGSYFATIPRYCYLKTPEFTIANTDDKLRGNAVELISISQDGTSNILNHRPPLYNFTTIDLEKLHNIQHQVLMENPTSLETTDFFSIYHTTIPLYIIALLGAAVLSIVYIHRRQRVRTTDTLSSLESNEERSSPQERRAAIFALNVRK